MGSTRLGGAGLPVAVVLWLGAAPGVTGCYDRHSPVGAGRPDGGLAPRADASSPPRRPDGGVPGECLPGDAALRGETPVGPAEDYVFVVARTSQESSCSGTDVSLVVSAIPPGPLDAPVPSLLFHVLVPDVDLTVADEPVSLRVPVEATALTDAGLTSPVEGEGHLLAEPVELGRGQVLLELGVVGDGWELSGRLEAVYCSLSVCL